MIKNISLTGDVTGISVVEEETGKAEINTIRRGCSVYRGSLEDNDRPWYKIASVTYPKTVYQNLNISLLINYTYAHVNVTGILKAMIRINGGNLPPSGSMVWEYNTGIDKTDAVLVLYKEGNFIVSEIWYRNGRMYQTVTFDVLSESVIHVRTTSLWELYSYNGNTQPGVSEIPSEYTQISATLATIQNQVERALSANAVDGIYRYESKSGTNISIPFYPEKRYLCAASMLGGNGVNGYAPVVFILEFPYNNDEADPKITHVFRSSENYVVRITREDNWYTINVLYDSSKMSYVTLLMMNIL